MQTLKYMALTAGLVSSLALADTSADSHADMAARALSHGQILSAESHFKLCLREDSANKDCQLGLAELLTLMDRPEEAIALFDLNALSETQDYLVATMALNKLGRQQEGHALLNRAVEISLGNAPQLLRIASMFRLLGYTEEAELTTTLSDMLIEEAAAINPNVSFQPPQ